MAKRVFVVHRWGGNPDSDWYPWLKKMLEHRKFEVIVPEMPNTNEPHIAPWVTCLARAVGNADLDTYFIGHSIGCQTIMRYLVSLRSGIKIGGAVFVAGWFHLIQDDFSESDREIADEWIGHPIDMNAVRSHLGRSTALFSDNDPYVPLTDSVIFEKELGSKIIKHPKRGHFTSDDGASELHTALNEILRMAKD